MDIEKERAAFEASRLPGTSFEMVAGKYRNSVLQQHWVTWLAAKLHAESERKSGRRKFFYPRLALDFIVPPAMIATMQERTDRRVEVISHPSERRKGFDRRARVAPMKG